MRIGMVGLGRMGANLVRRLMHRGHACVVYDVRDQAIAELQDAGAIPASSLVELGKLLSGPRVVWVMTPPDAVDVVLGELETVLDAGDVIVDGGNSFYRETISRAERLRIRGISLVDCGTSGGVWGLNRGYCLMVGGDPKVTEFLSPIFRALVPEQQGARKHSATAPREDQEATSADGYLRCGPTGAGHFVKMVHNGIEYGMMAAIAEGLSVIHHAALSSRAISDLRPTQVPVRTPEMVLDVNAAEVADVWRQGSVVASWLLDLTARALASSPDLSDFVGYIDDSGHGRGTVLAAIEMGVPIPTITSALYSRFESRGNANFANRIQSAMRLEFGGHPEHLPTMEAGRNGS